MASLYQQRNSSLWQCGRDSCRGGQTITSVAGNWPTVVLYTICARQGRTAHTTARTQASHVIAQPFCAISGALERRRWFRVGSLQQVLKRRQTVCLGCCRAWYCGPPRLLQPSKLWCCLSTPTTLGKVTRLAFYASKLSGWLHCGCKEFGHNLRQTSRRSVVEPFL